MPLLWRVFLVNAALMAGAVVLLLVTPVTVSFPASAHQVGVALAGLACVLVIDLVLLRSYITPLQTLSAAMADVDLLEPGVRVKPPARTPEVRIVSDAFNAMLDRLEEDRLLGAQVALVAQERERVRVSRELHDGVGQRLTGALLRLQSIESRAPDELGVDLAAIRDEVRGSLEDVRETARRLRPEALEDLGLASALAALTQDLARAAGLLITRNLDGPLDDLGEELEVAVYRIAQEALTNVVRHAEARHALLTVTRKDGHLLMTVNDDGRGVDLRRTPAGTGLTGMRERALLVGGRLRVFSRPGEGTEVRLAVDLEAAA
jgi:two-component system sensor histidine kinase UhpB